MIIGHERQIELLRFVAQSGRIPHAFVFAGPDHIGKRLIAVLFFWLCAKPKAEPNEFFKEDPLARAFLGGFHPDIFKLNRETDRKEISIDQVRALKRFVGFSPFELERKFVLIDDAHFLSVEAANSLLKTLEEPAGKTTLILVTPRPSALPATITSRALRINFYPLNNLALAESVKQEGGSINPKEFDWIAGRPGLAITYLRDPKNNTVAKYRESFNAFSRALATESIRQKFLLAEQVAADEEIIDILESWLIAARTHLAREENGLFLDLVKRLKQCRELFLKTNVNVRLQLQDMLLAAGRYDIL